MRIIKSKTIACIPVICIAMLVGGVTLLSQANHTTVHAHDLQKTKQKQQ